MAKEDSVPLKLLEFHGSYVYNALGIPNACIMFLYAIINFQTV